MTSDEIANWISTTYNVPDELLPNWCICTGHGLHLYFIVDEIDFTDDKQSKIRDHYTQMLICYFNADITCRNRNHILRLPYSNNCKQDAIQTKLHHLNTSTDTRLNRLDYFYRTDDEIIKYKIDSYKEIAEKSAKTRLANSSQSMPDFSEVFREKSYDNTLSHNYCVDPKTMKYFDDFRRNACYWNIIKDLHNYYLRHNGIIIGRRNIFIHIMACYLKMVHMPLDEALDYIEPYCTVDFLDEARQTVTYVYKTNTEYHYQNDTIGLLLGFTNKDYMESHSCFNDASREARRKQYIRKANAKRHKEACTEKKDFKKNLEDFIRDNESISSSDIAIIYGVSTRTIQRIKKKLKED